MGKDRKSYDDDFYEDDYKNWNGDWDDDDDIENWEDDYDDDRNTDADMEYRFYGGDDEDDQDTPPLW